jgi:hypothetical protein
MITFKVTPDDGTEYEVTATPRDVLLWERQTRDAKFSNFASPSYADIYGLAFFASKRQRMFDGNRATFEDTCEVQPIEDVQDYEPDSDGEVGPTTEDR